MIRARTLQLLPVLLPFFAWSPAAGAASPRNPLQSGSAGKPDGKVEGTKTDAKAGGQKPDDAKPGDPKPGDAQPEQKKEEEPAACG